MSTDNQATELLKQIYNTENDNKLKRFQQESNDKIALMNQLELNIHLEAMRHFFQSAKNLIDERGNDDEFSSLFANQSTSPLNISQALNTAKNSQGQSLLNYALQNQNFGAANSLMNHGAQAGPEERACFELAMDSDAGRKLGYDTSKLQASELPDVKKYGLTLGIVMTSADGKTHSQFAHIQPTYQLMTDFAKHHAKNHPENANFQKIASAYHAANQSAQMQFSTSTNIPKAGEELQQRILNGQVTTIPISCKGHAMGLSVVPDDKNPGSGYLVFTNRGLGKGPNDAGTQIYKIDDLKRINPQFINTMINGHSNGTPPAQIMSQIHRVTDHKPPVQTLNQKDQKYDNCSIANTRANVHGILMCLKANSKGGFEKLSKQDSDEVRLEYKEFTHAMRKEKVQELAKALKNNPGDPDLKMLAKTYLQQHPRAPLSLREPLEKLLIPTTDKLITKQQESKSELQTIRSNSSRVTPDQPKDEQILQPSRDLKR